MEITTEMKDTEILNSIIKYHVHFCSVSFLYIDLRSLRIQKRAIIGGLIQYSKLSTVTSIN